MPYDQRETPYLDAAMRYRATGYTPFHTPGHKLGKGAPAGLREFMGDMALGVDLAMAGGVEDTRESTGPHPARRGLRRRGVGLGPLLVPGQRLQQRRARPAAHARRARRDRHRAPQRPQVHACGAHLHRLPAALHGAGHRSAVGHPAAGAHRRRARGPREGSGRARPLRHLAHLQRPRRRPAGHRGARAPRGRALRHRPGVGAAPALLPGAARRRHDRRRGRRGGQHAQAHQRPHPVGRAAGARRADEPRAPGRHGAHDAEHQPAGAHVRQHRRRAAADGRARRRAVAARHRARRVGPRQGRRAARPSLPRRPSCSSATG